MKYLFQTICLTSLAMLTACSNNDEPAAAPPVKTYLSSISSVTVEEGYSTESSQTFQYDETGRILKWDSHSESSFDTQTSVQYSYPDENTINVKSESESLDGNSPATSRSVWSSVSLPA